MMAGVGAYGYYYGVDQMLDLVGLGDGDEKIKAGKSKAKRKSTKKKKKGSHGTEAKAKPTINLKANHGNTLLAIADKLK